jgi:hypothetical protein
MIPERLTKRRRFVLRQARFGIKPNDIVEVFAIPPIKGQLVMVQLRKRYFEVARYMVRHLELDNGLSLVGVMDRIIGVVFKV